MGIDPVSSAQGGINNLGQAIRRDKGIRDTAEPLPDETETPAAVFERSKQSDQSVYTTYGRYSGSSNTVPAREAAKYAGLSRLIESLFGLQAQGSKAGNQIAMTAAEQNDGDLEDYIAGLEVDGATRSEARQVITEDGYWGVRQTSQRIIQFAIRLSGVDASRLETLKGAILKGYEEAEQTWGGALPDICRQTMEAALKGLDEWAGAAEQGSAAT